MQLYLTYAHSCLKLIVYDVESVNTISLSIQHTHTHTYLKKVKNKMDK